MGKRERFTTIISLWPRTGFREHRAHGDFEMPPAPRCETHQKAPCSVCLPYAKLVIGRRVESADMGDDRHININVDDLELATDLAEARKHFGIAVIEGDEPTRAELEAAGAEMSKYLRMVLDQEDQFDQAMKRPWNREHAQIALIWFGETRTWQADNTPKKPCEACTTQNPATAARCSNPACGAVQDWEKARRLGVLRDREIEFGLASGYLKRIEAIDGPEPEVAPQAPAVAGGRKARPLADAP